MDTSQARRETGDRSKPSVGADGEAPISWLEWWAIARVDLQLSTREFGRLTPRKFAALIHRLEMKDEKQYIAAGIVASTVANTAPFADPQREASNPLDFVPGWKQKNKLSTKKEMSLEEQIALLSGAFGCGPAGKGKTDGKEKS